MVPTKVGISLIKGFTEIDPYLISATLRSSIEKKVDSIAKGLESYDKVLQDTLDLFRAKFSYFQTNICVLETHFAAILGNYLTKNY